MTAAIFLPCLLALSLIALPSTSGRADDQRPAAGRNNVWYAADDQADTVIVFVHGLASDSRDVWHYEGEGGEKDAFWPALVRDDPAFEGSAIFLGGYHTRFDSHDYDFRDAANELHRSLAIAVEPAGTAVLDKPNILFVTHSAGGIVVRHMLTRHTADFADKAVGLALIASPSIGAHDADRLSLVADVIRSEQGHQLTFDNAFLKSLDKDFKNLVSERRIPRLVGVEWLEHHLVSGKLGKILGIVRDEILVEEQSAGRYFGEPIRMAGTDHFSIVKPASRDDDAHRALVYFYQRGFRKVMKTSDDTAADIQVTTEDEALHAAPAKETGTNEAETPATAGPASQAAELTAPVEPAPAKPTAPAVPVRIDEKRSAALCGDKVELGLTSVWKRGNGKPRDVVSIASGDLDRGEAVVKIGETLTFAGGCQTRLIKTGRDSSYYAIFE